MAAISHHNRFYLNVIKITKKKILQVIENLQRGTTFAEDRKR